MAFKVTCENGVLRIGLSGWDRLMTWRRALHIDLSTVRSASVEERALLEAGVDHRSAGTGTHDGRRRPGRRRVGSMLGRGVQGSQFWAVSSGPPTARLLVLDLQSGPFARVVLEADARVEALSLIHI